MKAYLGIVGKNSAGKETVYQIMQELIVKHAPSLKTSIHHFSDPLRECLAALKPLESNKENQQTISTALRQFFGEEVLGNTLNYRVVKDSANIVCIDGVRRPQDVIKLRKLPNFCLIFVDAPFEKRFQHAQTRKDRPAPTREEFLTQENAEPERLINEIGRQADIVIKNHDTVEKLKTEVLVKILIRKLGVQTREIKI